MSELTGQEIARALGLKPKPPPPAGPEADVQPETEEPAGEVQPDTEATPIADTEQQQGDEWLVPGFPRPLSLAEQREQDRRFVEMLHPSPNPEEAA